MKAKKPNTSPKYIYNQNIDTSSIDSLVEQVFDDTRGGLFPALKIKSELIAPPFLIYQESRASHNGLSCFSYYGGRGAKGGRYAFSAGREILNIQSNYPDEYWSGRVLIAASQIDYVLDVLICIGELVFRNIQPYSAVAHEIENEGHCFSTSKKKADYLKRKKMISTETFILLGKVRRIRNILAHQFIPQPPFGVSPSDIDDSASILDTIETIYNAAWFYLLQDYARHQEIVLVWLKQKADE